MPKVNVLKVIAAHEGACKKMAESLDQTFKDRLSSVQFFSALLVRQLEGRRTEELAEDLAELVKDMQVSLKKKIVEYYPLNIENHSLKFDLDELLSASGTEYKLRVEVEDNNTMSLALKLLIYRIVQAYAVAVPYVRVWLSEKGAMLHLAVDFQRCSDASSVHQKSATIGPVSISEAVVAHDGTVNVEMYDIGETLVAIDLPLSSNGEE